ncbi:MAG: alpha/beta fold hydrolase [Alphaproteobacteria bacterium]
MPNRILFRFLTVIGLLALTAAACGGERAQAFRVTVTGQGPDLLLIPGLASSMAVWEDTAAAFEDRYRVHRFTLAGFAGVPPVPGPVLETRKAALVRYLEEQDLTGVTLAGHSLGGVMGMLVAEAAPERVARLIIVDSLPFVAELFFRAETVSEARSVADNLRTTQRLQPPSVFFAQQRAALAGLTKQTERLSDLSLWLVTSDKDTLIDALHEMFTLDLRPRLAGITAETTVIYAHDRIMPIGAAALDRLYGRQYGALPSKTLERIDRSFHFVMFDRPDAFRDAFARALANPSVETTQMSGAKEGVTVPVHARLHGHEQLHLRSRDGCFRDAGERDGDLDRGRCRTRPR